VNKNLTWFIIKLFRAMSIALIIASCVENVIGDVEARSYA